MKAAAAIFLLMLAAGILPAQDFTRFYQDSADLQAAKQLLPGRNKTLWLGGYKIPAGDNSRAWIYHLNEEGDVLEKYHFPGNQEQIWAGMDTIGNGVAAITGLREAGGEISYYLSICRSDSLISQSYLPELDNAVLDDVRPAAGRKLLICGFRNSPGIAGNDFFIARVQIDSAKTDWAFQDGFGPNDHISMAKELPDGSVLFCGTVASQGNNYNPCIGKLDSAGNQLWLNVVDTPWNDGAQKFTLDENGDIWLVGESSTSAGSFFDTEIFRFNSDGQLILQQWLGSPGQDAAFVIERKLLSSGFWVAGYSNAGSNGSGPISPFLMSLDTAGNSLGEAFWNLTAPSPVYSMLNRGDSLFYFCGITANKGFLMKRKNPSLSPVFVVNTQPISGRKTGITPGFYELEDAFRKGEISSIRLMDLSGRLIAQIDNPRDLPELPLAKGGYYLLTIALRTGEVFRMPYFGQRR